MSNGPPIHWSSRLSPTFHLMDDVTIAKMQSTRNHHDQHVEHDDLIENMLGFCNFVTYENFGSYEKRVRRSHSPEVAGSNPATTIKNKR